MNNLRKHIMRHHAALFDSIQSAIDDEKQKQSEALQNFVVTAPTRPDLIKNITVHTSFLKIAFSLLKEIVIHGRPIMIIEDSGIRNLLDPMISALKSKHGGIP